MVKPAVRECATRRRVLATGGMASSGARTAVARQLRSEAAIALGGQQLLARKAIAGSKR